MIVQSEHEQLRLHEVTKAVFVIAPQMFERCLELRRIGADGHPIFLHQLSDFCGRLHALVVRGVPCSQEPSVTVSRKIVRPAEDRETTRLRSWTVL